MLLWGFILLIAGAVVSLGLFLSNLTQIISGISANGFGGYVGFFFDQQYLSTGKVVFLIAVAAAILGLVLYLVGRAKNTEEKNPVIPERIKKYFRDTKSECKKIVWPSFGSVVRNTGVVLVMCAVTAVLILVVDLGLSALIKLLLSL